MSIGTAPSVSSRLRLSETRAFKKDPGASTAADMLPDPF